MAGVGRLTIAVSWWNISTLLRRLRSAIVVVIGFFGVVLVFVAILSIQQGIQAMLAHSGSDEVAIVFPNSGLFDGDKLGVIGQAPGVSQSSHGPVVMGTYVVTVQATMRGSGVLGAMNFRGVSPEVSSVWPDFRIIQGRMFRPGVDEIIVGRQAERLFKGLSLGDMYYWNHRRWKVVGVFAKSGGLRESEIWTDVDQLQAALKVTNQYYDSYVRLVSATAFPLFKRALEQNPQLNVTVVRESTSFEQNAQSLYSVIFMIGGLITLLMAIGAIFGALNIMYANVTSRIQDIATLRALGFPRLAILFAVVLEGIVLGLVGGIAAAIVAYLIFNGYQTSTLGNGAMMAFSLAVTPQLIITALVLAVIMGFIGGLFPAIRAARLPVAQVLSEG